MLVTLSEPVDEVADSADVTVSTDPGALANLLDVAGDGVSLLEK